jgi:hypothetical protein
LSWVLLALAAVGLIMRERKSPLGAALEVVEARESGRAIDGRDDLVPDGATGFGRVAVDGFRVIFASSPCLAADAAVGATRRDGSPTGRVGDFGRGFLKPVGELAVLVISKTLGWVKLTS